VAGHTNQRVGPCTVCNVSAFALAPLLVVVESSNPDVLNPFPDLGMVQTISEMSVPRWSRSGATARSSAAPQPTLDSRAFRSVVCVADRLMLRSSSCHLLEIDAWSRMVARVRVPGRRARRAHASRRARTRVDARTRHDVDAAARGAHAWGDRSCHRVRQASTVWWVSAGVRSADGERARRRQPSAPPARAARRGTVRIR